MLEEWTVIDTGQLIAERYRLMETVGTGSMGVVWQARDERLGRVVAVKHLLIQPGRSPEQAEEARRRAMREARIAARLQHNNAIAVYDVVEHNGEPCMVMEYLPSRSLAGVLNERGALSPREVAEIGSQAATALAAAHTAGIVHRDIKPANILIDYAGTVKITDFGISRAADDGTITQTAGMLAGTPAYLAPEVAQGQEHTHASDVFSLGSTLYHAVEGEPPYGFKDNPLAQLYAVAMGEEPTLRYAGALIPVLSGLLKRDPSQRPNMQQVRHQLARVASVGQGGLAGSLESPPPDQQPAPTRQEPAATPTMVGGAVPPTAAKQPEPASTKAKPPKSAKPAESAKPAGSRRRKVLFGALAAVVLLAGVTAAILLNQSPPEDNGNQAQTPAQQSSQQQSSPPPSDTAPEGGPVNDYSAAGQLVVAYYGNEGDLGAAWNKLTPSAQQRFAGRAQFEQYWNRYDQTWACCANQVSNNADGSANVPVKVTYLNGSSEREQSREVRVTRQNGQLLIDSVAK